MRALEIENRFRQLDGLLQTVRNKRIRTVQVFEFIDEVWENKHKFKSYIPLVAQHLPETIDPADWSGVSPEQSLNWIETAQKVNVHFEDAIEEPFIVQLIELHLLTLLLTGELSQFRKTAERFGFSSPSIQSDSGLTEQINSILNAAPPLEHLLSEEKDRIRNVLHLYRRAATEKSGTIRIPTQAYMDLYPNNSYGSLRELTIKIQERMPRGKDVVETNFAVASTENASDYFAHKVIEPTRYYLKNNFKDLDASPVRAYFRYLRNDGIHDGESSNAGLALLFVAELHRYFDKRKRLSIQKNVAITGGLNPDGTIGEVSDESIPYKVEACFFSGIETLVVPESQKEQFRVKKEDLIKRYPNKQFQILGASTLDDLFSDRRIIRSEKIPVALHLSGKLWKKKFETSGLLVIALLTTIIMRLLVGPIDQNPVMGEFTGEVLKVKNQYGSILETIHVGESSVRQANGVNTYHRRNLIEFLDVDGNGKNELFWSEIIDSEGRRGGGVLHGRSLLENDPIWSTPLSYELNYPGKPYVIGNIFHPSLILSTRFPSSARDNLIVVSNHQPFYPGVIAVKDPKSGEPISEFINSGRIYDVVVLELNGNGKQKLIFSGVNNAFNMAFIAKLDLDNIDGQSPHTDEYLLEGYEIPKNLKYVLIPKTKIGLPHLASRAYNEASRIRIYEQDGLIHLRVFDLHPSDSDELFSRSNSSLVYYFNFDLSFRGIGTSDGYDLAASTLFDRGIIDSIPDHNYFRQHGEKLLYWNGEEFVGWSEYVGD